MPVQMTLREFRKVALPDFLWLLTMLHARPLLAGPGATGRALDLAQAAMKRAHARGAVAGDQAPVFHGLLTDWERLPEQERAEVLEEFCRRGIYDDVVPETFAHALAVYSEPPGRWLIEPRLQAGLVPSTKEAEKLLWELVRLGGSSHQPLATHAIYLWIVALVKMDRIRHGGEPVFIDILPRYPNNVNDAERSIAESTLRAMFLPAFHNRPEAAETQEWCQRFWRANRALYECYRKEPEPPDPTDLEKVEIGYARCARLQREFLVAARDTDPDLWDSDRYDVLTGMAWRALRMAGHLIGHPAQWSEEHGYSAIRGLFEAIVQMRWMLAVEETRPGVWNEFKDYGRGRTKALKLHTEEALQKATGMPKEILAGLLPKLEEEVNRDISGDFQDISTASTFIDNKACSRWPKKSTWATCTTQRWVQPVLPRTVIGPRSMTCSSTDASISCMVATRSPGSSLRRSRTNACRSSLRRTPRGPSMPTSKRLAMSARPVQEVAPNQRLMRKIRRVTQARTDDPRTPTNTNCSSCAVKLPCRPSLGWERLIGDGQGVALTTFSAT